MGNIFPYDEDMNVLRIRDLLQELASQKRIELGTYDGELYIRIPNFHKHQTIDKPSKFRFLKDGWGTVAEHSTSVSGVVPEDSTMKEKVKEKVNVKEKVKEKEKDLYVVTNATTSRLKADDEIGRICETVVGELNRLTGSAFSPRTKTTIKAIRKLLNDKFTQDDFIQVVNFCYDSWATDSKMSQFLTPASIFRTDKFEDKLERSKNMSKSPGQASEEALARAAFDFHFEAFGEYHEGDPRRLQAVQEEEIPEELR